MSANDRAGLFSGRVAVVFGTQAFGAALGILNGILLARLLGPAAKGDYYLLVLVPTTVIVLAQLGLPAAFGFFSAKGQTLGIRAKGLVLTAILSSAGLLLVLALLPLLRGAILRKLDLEQILFALLVVPMAFNAMFSSSIILGRQLVRWYSAVNIVNPIATSVLLVLVLGGLGAGVNGALVVYLITSAIQTVGFSIGARRACTANANAKPVSYRELVRYGLPLYPASISAFFSYRVDAYIIAGLIADPSASLGYYSTAVGLAEMVFLFPNAVSTMFFPHVAGSSREDANRQVAMVVRVTLLLTAALSLLLIPAAVLMIYILLPAFESSIPPFLVLLPGVVALSAAKVVGGYMSGVGRPGINSGAGIAGFAVNLVANFILIPRFGIVGAAAASLVSYTSTALLLTGIAARSTHTPLASFWIPRVSDVRYVLAVSVGLLRRLRTVPRALRGHPGA